MTKLNALVDWQGERLPERTRRARRRSASEVMVRGYRPRQVDVEILRMRRQMTSVS
jgi:hypothetical protein